MGKGRIVIWELSLLSLQFSIKPNTALEMFINLKNVAYLESFPLELSFRDTLVRLYSARYATRPRFLLPESLVTRDPLETIDAG